MLWSIFITYIITHHGLGGFSGPINGLIAAAISALSIYIKQVNSFVKIGIVQCICVDPKVRQKHKSALYIFIHLDFQLVVTVK